MGADLSQENCTIDELMSEMECLPSGYISRKVIRGKECFYHQWKEDGRLVSRYLKEGELEPLREQIERRRSLQEKLRFEKARESSRLRVQAYAVRYYMGRPVPVGVQSYETLITKKLFYVDKTFFIRDWWNQNDEVTLIARPRRFGKTLNMHMVECFFSNRYSGRSDLFEGLTIWKYREFQALQGTYPVLFLSFGAVKMHTPEGIREQLMGQLDLKLWELLDQTGKDALTEEEKLSLNRYLQTRIFPEKLQAIPFLCRTYYRIYGKKTIILLDEYDTPALEAWTAGIWQEVADDLRNLLNIMFMSNSYLERALLTGITRISRESFFSDLNHLKVADMTSDSYATAFGFTEKEVFDAMDEQHLTNKQEVKEWYDGFRIGAQCDIYNPWSIVNFLSEHELKAYWVHSASNRLISSIFRSGDRGRKMLLEDLMKDRPVFVPLQEDLSFQNLAFQGEAVWSLLFASGYLKIAEEKEDGRYGLIPVNREVKMLLVDMVKEWFDGTEGYSGFLEALLCNDIFYMNEFMERTVQSLFSFFDTSAEKAQPEKFYHGFILGLMVTLEKDYIIRSNRESGLGRADVLLEPRNSEGFPAIILEFKVHRGGHEKSLEETVESALRQIQEKKYETEFLERGIPQDRIYAYGIAFRGKEVLIRGSREDKY